ncbi:MAG: DsbA family protein [Alphaproteobacteria bacterium]
MKRIFIVTLSLLIFSTHVNARTNAVEKGAEKRSPPIDILQGKKTAPITVIEYSSYTCSHCATFHNTTFKDIKKHYIDTGKVKYIQRDFPLDKQSLEAALLTRCATKDNFARLSTVLFKKQKDWAYSSEWEKELRKIATASGMRPASIDQCLSNDTLRESVVQSRIEAVQAYGISGTPAFIVNGQKHGGAMSFDYFKVLFDKVLTPISSKKKKD